MVRVCRNNLFVTLVLALCAVTSVRAQDAAPPAAPTPAAPDPASTPAPANAATTPPATSNARLAPGGIAAEKGSGLPVHIGAAFSNSVGNGFLAATQYQRQPQWSTALSLSPSLNIAQLVKGTSADVLPKMRLGGSVTFSVGNWLPASSGEVYDRIVRVSDFGTNLSFPALFNDDTYTNISVTPSIGVRLPLSLASRQRNLAVSPSANVAIGWHTPEWKFGTFDVNYTPSVRGNIYTADSPSIPCDSAVRSRGVVTNPLLDSDEPLAYGRSAEILPNGECRLRGRQNVGSISNGIGAGWSLGGHSVSMELGWAVSFLRRLRNDPSLSSKYASQQNFNESSSGSISYTYTIPVDFNLSISAALGSEQGVWSADGSKPRFPFFDFFTPANNFSSGSLSLAVGI